MPNIHPPIPEEFQSTREELDAYREQIVRYLTAINVTIQMYKKGIINMDDYAKCEKMMAEKYGISDISVFRRRDPEDPNSLKNFHVE